MKTNFEKMLKSYSIFLERFREEEGRITTAAHDMRKLHQEKWREINPEDMSGAKTFFGKNHWVFGSDYIEVKLDNDTIYVEFWERGLGGDADEMLHRFTVNEEFMSHEHRVRVAEEWAEKERKRSDEDKRIREAIIQKNIRDLEDQLRNLRTSQR